MRSGRARPERARPGRPRRCAGSAPSSSCTSSRAGTWSTRARRSASAIGHLAARPLAVRLPRRGQPRRHHPAGGPRRPDAPAAPPPCWPPARPPTARGAVATIGRVRGRSERHQRDPVAGCAPGWTPAAPTRPTCRAVVGGRSRAPRGTEVGRGVLDARGRRSTPTCGTGSPTCSAAHRCCRPAPATTPASSPRRCRGAMLFVRNPTGRQPLPRRARRDGRLPRRRRGARHRAGRPRPERAGDDVPTPSSPGCRPAGSPRTCSIDGRRAAGSPRSPRATAGPGAERPARRADLPGLANAHSHAFHRALRGRTQQDAEAAARSGPGASRCTRVAGRLDPDPTSRWPGRRTPRWRWPASPASASSTTCTTRPGGAPYDDPNAMGHALVAGGREAGLRITLLDTCYLAGGIGAAARAACSAGSATATRTRGPTRAEALHDVVPRRAATSWSARPCTRCAPCRPTSSHRSPTCAERHAAPLHVHLSEQRAENDACLAAYGVTPDQAAARPRRARPAHHRRARHPPHRRRHRSCSAAPAPACACARPPSATWPTASARPADCATPARRVTLGSDSHAVIDLFEEARAVELDERLASRAPRPLVGRRAARRRDRRRARLARLARRRACSTPGAWPTWSRSRLDSVRTAGASEPTRRSGGLRRDRRRRHRRRRRRPAGRRRRRARSLGDVGALLAEAIAEARGHER